MTAQQVIHPAIQLTKPIIVTNEKVFEEAPTATANPPLARQTVMVALLLMLAWGFAGMVSVLYLWLMPFEMD